MSNKSIVLNQRLQTLVVDEMFSNLVGILKDKENHLICTDKDGRDPIYGYFYDGDWNLIEQQVKGILLNPQGEVFVCLDTNVIKYEENDLLNEEKAPDELWHNLFAGDLLCWFTMININEVIHEYL